MTSGEKTNGQFPFEGAKFLRLVNAYRLLKRQKHHAITSLHSTTGRMRSMIRRQSVLSVYHLNWIVNSFSSKLMMSDWSIGCHHWGQKPISLPLVIIKQLRSLNCEFRSLSYPTSMGDGKKFIENFGTEYGRQKNGNSRIPSLETEGSKTVAPNWLR